MFLCHGVELEIIGDSEFWTGSFQQQRTYHGSYSKLVALCGVTRCHNGKESVYQCKRCGLDPWVGRIPWGRKREPAPVFLPGNSHGQRSLTGYIVPGVTKSWTPMSARAAELALHCQISPSVTIYLVFWIGHGSGVNLIIFEMVKMKCVLLLSLGSMDFLSDFNALEIRWSSALVSKGLARGLEIFYGN